MKSIKIKIGPIEKEYVARLTTAPEDYDGFGTWTLEKIVNIVATPITEWRIVLIETEHLNWQESRYLSGWNGSEAVKELPWFNETDFAKMIFEKMAGLE